MASLNDCELVVQREVLFSRPLVWAAMTVPEHQNQWWGPDGFKNEDVRMDFRVGGAWTFVMVAPDGTRFRNRLVFKGISPPTHMVLDHATANAFGLKPTSTSKK